MSKNRTWGRPQWMALTRWIKCIKRTMWTKWTKSTRFFHFVYVINSIHFTLATRNDIETYNVDPPLIKSSFDPWTLCLDVDVHITDISWLCRYVVVCVVMSLVWNHRQCKALTALQQEHNDIRIILIFFFLMSLCVCRYDVIFLLKKVWTTST